MCGYTILWNIRHRAQAADDTEQYCLINVDQTLRVKHWPPNSPDLNTVDYTVWGPFNRWSNNINNSRQATSWNRRLSMSGANCRSVCPIAPLVTGIAGLSASSWSKVDTIFWCKNCKMWQLFWTKPKQ